MTGDREAGASAALARVDALHTALTDIVLEGGDLGRIAEEVGRVLDVGVLVTSSDGRERAAHLGDDHRAALAEHDLLDPTGRLRVERVRAEGTPLGAGEVRSLRIAAGGEDLARLVSCRTGSTIDEADVHALERAAAVAALLITREAAVTAVENKYRGDFLRDVFLRRAGTPEYVEEHAATFGWRLDRPVVVAVAELDPTDGEDGPPTGEQRRLWQERFSAAWRQVTATVDPGVPCVDFSSEVVALLPVPDGDSGEQMDDLAAEVVHRVVAAVRGDRGGGRRPFSVGVSRVAADLDALPEAYAQARRAVDVGRRVHGGASTTFFDQLGVHRLIALVPDPAELRAFARDVLGPLAEQTPETADLRETLRVLLDTNFNVAEAARAQFFHYNTMRYRVGKLEKLLGPLSSDPHLRLDVAVALRVLEIGA
ncbi:PucR family transcriptional regulator [Nocardioides sp. GCM10027113]|uniref:PucR family transcriptional regulator n=1 Tax=unclassified Nocardioides TaxID=2615069 RepID=UPI0036061DFD